MSVLRLKEILREKGLTGKELSEKVGVSKTSISQIITENQQPRFDLLLQIANALGVDVRDLFNPTMDNVTETIYAMRGGSYVPVGELKKSVLQPYNSINAK